jgi:hypothetical protein
MHFLGWNGNLDWLALGLESGVRRYTWLLHCEKTNVHDKRASQTSERRTFLNILNRNHYKNITNYSIN